MSKLVVVESPSKEKSIKKYLGEGYDVKASKGHVVDLPKKDLGVDVDHDFEPEYIVTNQKSLTGLKKAFKGKDTLVLAVDPDREGEAIGWHVAQRLGVISPSGKVKKGKKLLRFVFTEITQDAVQRAAQNPREIDMNLVDAQQTRRILDRLVGYKLSPLLWKKIRFGLSAGRVQSVAVKLIVDKEREREKFDSKEFWNIDSYLDDKKTSKKPEILIKEKAKEDEASIKEEMKDEIKEDKQKAKGIKFRLIKISDKKALVDNKKEADSIVNYVKGKEWKITDIKTDISTRRPGPPFRTSTLQQFAANKLGFSSKRTMQIAQRLYEAGLITYMRTDSIGMSMKAIEEARKFIQVKYGPDFVPEKANFYANKSKVAQEAHEAIRPTSFEKSSDSLKLDPQQKKLYDLIYRKALSSQASPAKVELTNVLINIDKYSFEAKGQRVLFSGFLKILSDISRDEILPKLEVGQKLYPLAIIADQNFTQPPARYTEATLIKVLEKYGIGRPSTYATIISTIQSRQYVTKEQRYFIPTDTGFIVTKLLEDHFPEIVDVGFTAELEEDLDEIANGKKQRVKTISEFYLPFAKTLKIKESKISREDYNILGKAPKAVKCPECKSEMINVAVSRPITPKSSQDVIWKKKAKNLFDLPIVTHFEKDFGPYITSSLVFVQNQETESQNLSTHRLLRLNDTFMVIRMVEGRHLHRCYSYAKEHGEDLRVSIIIGAHPAISIASAYQASYGEDELGIANALMGGRLLVTKAPLSGLQVPSRSEILMEGRIL